MEDADADRAFLRDVLGLTSVDAGGGWLIFGLPPGEVAVHPGEKNDVHELYLLTDDLGGLIGELRKRGVACSPPRAMSWGVLTQIARPGGGKLAVYEPRHARPMPMPSGGKRAASAARKPSRKAAARKVKRRRPRA